MRAFSKIKSLTALASAAALFAISGTQSASAAIYYFSFDSTAIPNMTTIDGPVRGTITLPDGDGTFLPTIVVITDYPFDLTGIIHTGLTPTEWTVQAGTGFTVSGGEIVAAQWVGEEKNVDLGTYNQIRFNFLGYNLLTFSGGPTNYVANNSGFSGVTYSSSPIPEPSTALLGALGSLALFRRKRA